MVDKIKIGHRIYKVIEDGTMTDSRGVVGEIDFHGTRIIISPRQEEQAMLDTLVHEAVHGMLNFMGEKVRNDNEATTERITSGVLMLIRDNPELFLRFARVEDEKGN